MNDAITTKLITAGVKNLREFGYPDCDASNILTDYIYARMFQSMLEDNLGLGVDAQINALLSRLANKT